ncbi:aminoglycoside phosphotransferase family protein [Kribbella sp. DT2]|uniref:aminoglycoside phosphotransferase family protein n=1 Tax=Kribbella sp. DT2 TaxID=3393427 RepID=UPI003CF3A4F4
MPDTRISSVLLQAGNLRRLPDVQVPGEVWFPDVEGVLQAFRSQLGVDATVLTCLGRGPGTIDYLLSGTGGPTGEAPHDELLVAAAQAHLALPDDYPLTPAWMQPAWYDEALAWIDEHLERTGPPTQVRSWGLSNVLRVPTASGDVYFKALVHGSTLVPDRPDATPLLFAHEPRLLDRLSTVRPGEVVRPIAVDHDRVWMLLPDLGTPLAEQTDVALWIEALGAHGRLQRSFTDSPDELLAMSCVDRRLDRLGDEIDRLFGPNGVTAQLTSEERDQLATRSPGLREAIAELTSIGVPETLLHADLHPGNVAVRDGRPIAFDWTDAAVAHPFLDLVTFVGGRHELSRSPDVRDAYLAVWQDFAPLPALRRALDLAGLLGALHQAVTSLHLADNVSGPSRDSMQIGGRWWLRKLLELTAT